MSLFGNQIEPPSPIEPPHVNGQGAYGIGDLIRLLKNIPIDHHPELVVQVIKTTLESVGVRSSDVVEDALVQENRMRDALEMLETQIGVLAQEIEARQTQIHQLHVTLQETMAARSLLANAEPPSAAVPSIDLNLPELAEPSEPGAIGTDEEPAAPKVRSLPPPLPPRRRKTA